MKNGYIYIDLEWIYWNRYIEIYWNMLEQGIYLLNEIDNKYILECVEWICWSK